MIKNINKAVIQPEKLTDYLLSTSHPSGKFKAKFFQMMGYSKDNWKQLEADIRLVLHNKNEIVMKEKTEYGQKFEVKGIITTPLGRKVEIVTVWIICEKENFPRFITAYP